MLCVVFSFLGMRHRMLYRRVSRVWRCRLEANKALWENRPFVPYQTQLRKLFAQRRDSDNHKFLGGNTDLQKTLCMASIIGMSIKRRCEALLSDDWLWSNSVILESEPMRRDVAVLSLTKRQFLLTDEGVVILVVGLFTLNQVVQFTLHELQALAMHSCITAIQEGYLTVQQLMAMPQKGYVPYTPTTRGLSVLREHLSSQYNTRHKSWYKHRIVHLLIDAQPLWRCQTLFQHSDLADVEYLWLSIPTECASTKSNEVVQHDSLSTRCKYMWNAMWKACFVAIQEGLLTVQQVTGLDIHYLFSRYADELTSVQRLAHIATVQDLVWCLTDGGINGIAAVPGRPLMDLPSFEHLSHLLSPHGTTALREGLLTIQDVIDHFEYATNLQDLLCTNGITALRDGLLTVKQAVALAHSGPDWCGLNLMLIGSYGLLALREGLLTAQEAIDLSDAECLHCLLDEWGLTLLREKLLTVPQAIEFGSVADLDTITHSNGLVALREGLLTMEAVNPAKDGHHLDILLVDNGIIALREGLFTLRQFLDTTDEKTLLYMVSEEGIAAYRAPLSPKTTDRKRPRSPSPELYNTGTCDQMVFGQCGCVSPFVE